jgi:hypothetical protein
MDKFLVFIMIWLVLPMPYQAYAQSQVLPQNATSPLGINLAGVNYYNTAQPFINLVLQASGWGFGHAGLNGNLSDLSLDANGWPTSSFRGASGTTYTDGLGIYVINYDPPIATGEVTVICNATALLTFADDITGTVTCPTTGTNKTYTRRSGGFWVTITGMDQTNNGNHLTQLAIIPSNHISLYKAGQIFNPDYLSVLAPYRVARFIDWQNTAAARKTVTSWSTRPVPQQPFYGANTQVYGNGRVIPEGVPVEIEVALCNALNMGCWFNIPVYTTDDYVTNHAAYTATHLDPGVFAYYEYFNEAWNTPGPVARLGAVAFPFTITGITLGNPTVIAYSPPGGGNRGFFANGRTITISGITVGPTVLNGNTYSITGSGGSFTPGQPGTVSINVDTTGGTAWVSGGAVQLNDNIGVGLSYYSMQAAHLMDLIMTKWSGKTSNLIRVIGAQAAGGAPNSTLLELGGPSQQNLWSSTTAASHFDAIAYAPYFGYGVPDSWSAGGPGLTSLFQEINSGGAIPSTNGANITTNSGNNYLLTSSANCGNGAIGATPANGTMTCFKANATNAGNATLTVDGGTQHPLYKIAGPQSAVSSYQIGSGGIQSGSSYIASFTSQTGAPGWSSSATYGAQRIVSGSDGNTYVSRVNSNSGNNPIGDSGVHWQAITPAWWICNGCSPAHGGMIAQSAGWIRSRYSDLATIRVSNLKIIGYEMGQSIVNIADTFTYYLMSLANADTRMSTAYGNYLSALKSANMNIMLHYNDIGPYGIFGTWGFKQHVYDSTSPKQNALQTWILSNPRSAQPYLLKRDLDPAANDNAPAFLNGSA